MDKLTSFEYQQLIIAIIDGSYAPMATAYVSLWALCIAHRIFGAVLDG